MKKLLNLFVVFILGIVFLGLSNSVYAANCSTAGITLSGNINGRVFQAGTSGNSIDFSVSGIADLEYTLIFRGDLMSGGTRSLTRSITGNNSNASFSENSEELLAPGDWTIRLVGAGIGGVSNSCDLASYEVVGARCQNVSVFQDRSSTGEGDMCYGGSGGGCIDVTQPVTVRSVTMYGSGSQPFLGRVIHDELGDARGSSQGSPDPRTGIFESTHGPFDAGTETVIVRQDATVDSNPELCRITFNVSLNCDMVPEENRCVDDEPVIIGGDPITYGPDTFSLCKQIPVAQFAQRQACMECTGGSEEEEGDEGVWTAVGCINKDPQAIIRKFISVGLGMGGGVALLTFLAAGFIYSTSQGDPKAYGKAKEMMTASIIGLIFIIFSVTILQFTGSTILRIPGFGGSPLP